MMRTFSTTLLLTSGLAGYAHGQTLTIPQAVERARPGPLLMPKISELAVADFESAITDADFIVQASLKKISTYLSDDQMTLYTDYEIVPTNTIADRQARVTQSPGRSSLILRMWGGETTIKGVEVKIWAEEMPVIPTDTPLLLFLMFNRQIDKYQLYMGASGIYEIRDGTRLQPVGRPVSLFNPRVIGMDISAAIREIHRRGR